MPRRVAAIDAPWGVCASDRNELVAGIEAIPAALGRLETALADNRPTASRSRAWPSAARGYRTHDFRPAKAQAPRKAPRAD